MQTKFQSKNSNIKKTAKRLLPLAGVIITLLVQVLVPDNTSHPVAKEPTEKVPQMKKFTNTTRIIRI